MAGESVFRVVRSQDYVTISNYHLRDKRLSLAAKGLMSFLLTDEGDAAYTVRELTELGPEGRDAIRTALRRLEECGYIVKRQSHDGGGRFGGNEYLLYETPFTEKPFTENPSTVAPFTGKPFTENPSTVDAGAELVLDQGLEPSSPEGSVFPEGKKEIEKDPPTSPPGKSAPRWKPERFAAFWAFYREKCRGESKQAAVRAWDKLRPDDALIDEIGRALVRQLKTDEWQRGIGIPYASTYLNQRRWEDDVGSRRGDDRSRTVEEPEDVIDWRPGVVPS